MENKNKSYIWLYIFFSIMVLGGGSYSIYYRVNSLAPYLYSLDTDPTDTNPIEQRRKELAELRNKDTDQDGLSDFDELFLHHTSPYIQDSDSDGKLDKVELDAGTNPNCPEGQTCLQTTTNNTTNSNASGLVNKSADDIRTELEKLGMSKEELDQMSDTDLISAYNNVMSEVETTNTNQLTNVQNLNISQIKDLLRQNGLTDDQLQGIDDATLQQLYQETLKEQTETTNQ